MQKAKMNCGFWAAYAVLSMFPSNFLSQLKGKYRHIPSYYGIQSWNATSISDIINRYGLYNDVGTILQKFTRREQGEQEIYYLLEYNSKKLPRPLYVLINEKQIDIFNSQLEDELFEL